MDWETMYGQLIGTSPKLLKSLEDVQKERDFEAQQQQRAQNLEAGVQMADAAGKAGTVDLDKNNPVSAAIDQINQQQQQ